MPGGYIETFFNELSVNLVDHEKYNPIAVNLAEIQKNPFYQLYDFDKLRQAKEEQIPEELEKIKEALMKSDSEDDKKQSLAFYATLTAFNFHAGSNESIRFLKALAKEAPKLGQLFLSKTI